MIPIHALGLVLACLVGGSRAPADRPEADAARSELERLRGVWDCAGIERDGKEDRSGPARAVAGHMTITIRGDSLRFEAIILGKKTTRSGTIRVDPTADPKRIDLTLDRGDEDEGRVVQGVYAVHGHTLKILWPNDAADHRPATLRTKERDGFEVHLFERRKEGPAPSPGPERS